MTNTILRTDYPSGVVLLTFNRPQRNNSWVPDMDREYFEHMSACESDPSVRVVVVTGNGKSYCPGVDVLFLSEAGSSELSERSNKQMPHSYVTQMSKPVISAINGICAGFGLAQALMCDIRFASDNAKFSTAFAKRGLVAEYGISWTLSKVVGMSNALDLLLSGRTFLAEEALSRGLVSAVVPSTDLLTYALEYATSLAVHSSPTSMAVIKKQVYSDMFKTLTQSEEDALTLAQESFTRPDFIEGVLSFIEKRPPNFPPAPASL